MQKEAFVLLVFYDRNFNRIISTYANLINFLNYNIYKDQAQFMIVLVKLRREMLTKRSN